MCGATTQVAEPEILQFVMFKLDKFNQVHGKSALVQSGSWEVRISSIKFMGSRVEESEVFGWSRIPNNTGSRCRIFLSDSDS